MNRPTYQQLMREHDEIEIAVQQLSRLANSPEESGAKVADAMAGLAASVADHLEKEETVRHPVMDELRERIPEEADRLKREFHSLVADWGVFVADWPRERIIADRAGFVADASGMMPLLRARVRAETELLYGPALRESVIRLRD